MSLFWNEIPRLSFSSLLHLKFSSLFSFNKMYCWRSTQLKYSAMDCWVKVLNYWLLHFPSGLSIEISFGNCWKWHFWECSQGACPRNPPTLECLWCVMCSWCVYTFKILCYAPESVFHSSISVHFCYKTENKCLVSKETVVQCWQRNMKIWFYQTSSSKTNHHHERFRKLANGIFTFFLCLL